MRVRLTKLTPDRHGFECVRDDGSVTRTELETRSTLRHDLMHYAVEQRARLAQSLYGTLAGGAAVDALPMGGDTGTPSVELQGTEVLVGMLQGAAQQQEVDAEAFLLSVREWFGLLGHAAPSFVTADFVRAVLGHYHRLHGQWQSLRVGGVLELTTG